MLSDQTPYYQYPANVCFAFAPSRRSASAREGAPGRGEPLVFVAGTVDMPWRIFRGDEVLAEWSEIRQPRARATFGDMKKLLHTSWFEIGLGRRGGKAWMRGRFIPTEKSRKFKEVEGEPIECPAPQGKGLIGIGVADNGFVMPRFTLSAEKWHDARDEFPDPPDLLPLVYKENPEFARMLGKVMAAPHKPSRSPEPSRLHRAFKEAYGKKLVFEGFEEACWEGAVGGHDGCHLLMDDEAYSGGKSLLVASAGIGGRFELPLIRGAFPTKT